jgi:3-oxoacyl-[acyl-carrier protein] reductase
MKVFISGISGGIGRELVNAYLNAGDSIIASTRDATKLPKEIRDNVNVSIIEFDFLTQSESFSEKIQGVTKGSIDVVVNNAGLLCSDILQRIKLEDAYNMYSVNALMPLEVTRSLLDEGKLVQGASIVNISSMGGFQGAQKFEGLAAYSMSKAALVALTESMATEWSDRVFVNCLCLGAVNTEMLKTAFPNYDAPVSDVQMANFIHHFSKFAAKIMNGSVIPVSVSNP